MNGRVTIHEQESVLRMANDHSAVPILKDQTPELKAREHSNFGLRIGLSASGYTGNADILY